MQSLGIVPRLFASVEKGEKTSTIRWRESEVVPGFLRYVCNGAPTRTIVVWVTRTTHMPLSQAAAFLGREAVWPGPVMLEGMREHYPEIEWTDIVAVIEHLTPEASRRLRDYPD